MDAIFKADQAVREGDPMKIDWSKILPQDEARRRETLRLISEGNLHKDSDFEEAAFDFSTAVRPMTSFYLQNIDSAADLRDPVPLG
jgi:hypothetical protein